MELDALVYERTFDTFSKCNWDQPIIASHIRQLYKQYGTPKTGFKMLDVGGGTGIVIKHLFGYDDMPRPDKYVAFEPLAKHVSSLQSAVSKLNFTESKIYETCFDHETSPLGDDEQFDLILLSHSIYYFGDRIATMKYLQSKLTPTGHALVILNSANTPLPTIWNEMRDICKGMQDAKDDSILDGTSVTNELASFTKATEFVDNECGADLDDCFVTGNIHLYHEFLSFIANVDVTKLPEDQFNKMVTYCNQFVKPFKHVTNFMDTATSFIILGSASADESSIVNASILSESRNVPVLQKDNVEITQPYPILSSDNDRYENCVQAYENDACDFSTSASTTIASAKKLDFRNAFNFGKNLVNSLFLLTNDESGEFDESLKEGKLTISVQRPGAYASLFKQFADWRESTEFDDACTYSSEDLSKDIDEAGLTVTEKIDYESVVDVTDLLEDEKNRHKLLEIISFIVNFDVENVDEKSLGWIVSSFRRKLSFIEVDGVHKFYLNQPYAVYTITK